MLRMGRRMGTRVELWKSRDVCDVCDGFDECCVFLFFVVELARLLLLY